MTTPGCCRTGWPRRTQAGSPAAPAPGACAAKTRYRQQDAACTVLAAQGGAFSLQFPEAQWAVTPGQSAVLYDGEVCLGGGVIATVDG